MKTKATKRANARDLLKARLKRTPKEQLALLDKRPGRSRKERARLKALIEAGNGDKRGIGQYRVKDDRKSQK